MRYVRGVAQKFAAERAISANCVSFVVVDENFRLHAEACAYLASLRAVDRSVNTERVYAGRIARLLNYCEQEMLAWRKLSIDDLRRYLNSLVAQPITHELRSGEVTNQFRSNKTANAIVGTACEFLRYAASRDWVSSELIADLSQPKYLSRPLRGHDWGEDQQHRTIRARTLKLKEIEMAPVTFSHEQLAMVCRAATAARDRFLVLLLAETGIRIGEALGLRREDMHLLQSNGPLGCHTGGPHLHVRRRPNANGALAKSRYPRSIPVTTSLVDAYADYQYVRDEQLAGRDESDFVFVNLSRPPLGAPMRYHNVKKMFDRMAVVVGFPVRPHVFRHTAATRWLAAGTPRDVTQSLLGHASDASMDIYSHPSDGAKRQAVERAAASLEHDE